MSSSDSGPFIGLADTAERLAGGHTTSLEEVEAAIRRADAIQDEINPFRVIRRDRAREEAVAADRRLEAGERLPLLGVPVAIKDDSDIAGESTPFGCAGEFSLKTEDGEAVSRLRRAGAIVIGKTHTPELGLYPWTEGPAFAATRNPWDPAFTPGGSSGGSAAAVAAGVVAGAMGSDGAGSVRIPASWTNLVGVKPQRGRISTWPDPEAFNGITCNGTLTRGVADAALLLDVLTGNHPAELHRPPLPQVPYAESVRREPASLRVALSFRPPFTYARTPPSPVVVAAVERVAERLAALGHRVDRADPHFGVIGLAFIPRATAGVHEWCGRVPDATLLDPRTRESGSAGKRMSGALLKVARASERPIAAVVGRIFRNFDVVLTPTTATPPLPVGASDGLSNWQTERLAVKACPYAWPWNFLGWPAVSVPAGFTPEGLPIGAQLLGPYCSESLLLALAAQLEGEVRWDLQHPPGIGAGDSTSAP